MFLAGRRRRRPLQDKTPIYTSSQNKKYTLYPVSAFTLFTPAYPVSATPTAFAPQIGQFPLFSAGVQTMRARICSAFSCDMFARVVCLRLRRAAKLPTCVLSFVALTRHAWLARLTRARGGSFLRGGNEPMHAVRWLASPRQGECFLKGRKALLNDFWYFWSHKSTIRKKYLYVSSRETTGLPYYQNPNFINSQSKRLNPHSLFLLHMQAQKKKLSKRKRRVEISRSAERDRRRRRLAQAFEKA